jgi:hypothetical protein
MQYKDQKKRLLIILFLFQYNCEELFGVIVEDVKGGRGGDVSEYV